MCVHTPQVIFTGIIVSAEERFDTLDLAKYLHVLCNSQYVQSHTIAYRQELGKMVIHLLLMDCRRFPFSRSIHSFNTCPCWALVEAITSSTDVSPVLSQSCVGSHGEGDRRGVALEFTEVLGWSPITQLGNVVYINLYNQNELCKIKCRNNCTFFLSGSRSQYPGTNWTRL